LMTETLLALASRHDVESVFFRSGSSPPTTGCGCGHGGCAHAKLLRWLSPGR
jgi:hypothetical protein